MEFYDAYQDVISGSDIIQLSSDSFLVVLILFNFHPIPFIEKLQNAMKYNFLSTHILLLALESIAV